MLRTAVAAAALIFAAQVTAVELCGSVQGARILEQGRYQMSVLIDRQMDIINFYFGDYQDGGVPNECLGKTALGTRICFDTERNGGEDLIFNCRPNR